MGSFDSVAIKGGAWPSHEGNTDALLYPSKDWQDDETHGGRGNNESKFLAQPPVPVKRGDYVILDPKYAGDAIDYFDTVTAIREGTIRRNWPTFRRPGLAA
jgi:D-serine deaminase-like pyridoxal phosphate-dependent protein